jgi:hypothetical protein
MEPRHGFVKLREDAGCVGSAGVVPEGLYDFLQGGYRLLKEIKPGEANRLADALRRFEEGSADEDEVAEAAPDRVKGFIQKAMGKADKKFWAGALLALLLAVHTERAASESDEQVRDEVRRGNDQFSAQVHHLTQRERPERTCSGSP